MNSAGREIEIDVLGTGGSRRFTLGHGPTDVSRAAR
jgi:hypothetical protein